MLSFAAILVATALLAPVAAAFATGADTRSGEEIDVSNMRNLRNSLATAIGL